MLNTAWKRHRDNKLGKPIVDMIQQHHGSTLIKFFYNKAVERAGKKRPYGSGRQVSLSGPKAQYQGSCA